MILLKCTWQDLLIESKLQLMECRGDFGTIEFNQSTSCEKKLEMSASWQTYMKDNKCWLSFYEWLTQTKNEDVQMMESDSSSVRHKWKGLDGKK
jgi:hypothetical protein